MADEVTPPQPPEPQQSPEPQQPPEPQQTPQPPEPQQPPQLPQPPEPTVVEPDAAAARRPRTRRRRALVAAGWAVVATVLVAAVLAGIDIVTSNGGGGRSLRANPGDCFSRDSDRDLRRVRCDDPAVKWTVVGVVEHKSEQESKQNACQAWPNAEASYWETRNGTDGFVLCLGPRRPAETSR